MTFSTRTTPLDALDAAKRGSIPVWKALRLASHHRWLSRLPLWLRLKVIGLLRGMAFLALSLPFLAIGASGDVELEWQYPVAPSTNVVFVLRGSPVLTTNLSSWAVLTNISGLSTSATVRITPGRFFFTLSASNLWGESGFSPVVGLPPLPLPPGLSIRAAQP